MKSVWTHFLRLIGCRRGNFAMVTVVLIPILAGLTGGAVDVYVYNHHRTTLQNAADSAVLAATREAALKGWSKTTAEAVAKNFLSETLAEVGMKMATYSSVVEVDKEQRTVKVTVDQDHYGYFFLGYFKGSPQIRVSATAQASASENICVIGLEERDSGTISLRQGARLSANDCAVYSNSGARAGMESTENAVLIANTACSAGGYAGAPKNYDKPPVTDCPTITDPLANRRPPPVSTWCKYNNLVVKSGVIKTLRPGVYCGGLLIKSYAVAALLPGVYIIKDGPLMVESSATMAGVGVGFYFTGKGAVFSATSNSIVNLIAPDRGAMAGLLMFQDRRSREADFVIKSKQARNLLGTIYLPNGNFVVDTNNKIAEESAYTAIVARRLVLRSQPDLVLNTDYDKTTVPVPPGVGRVGGQPRIIH